MVVGVVEDAEAARSSAFIWLGFRRHPDDNRLRHG
jgi:hypothetical protein